MDLKTKLAILDQLYSIYSDFSSGLTMACGKLCADCCTRNVTMTSLEAYRIVDRLKSEDRRDLFDRLQAETGKKRFQPETTANKLADLCMRGDDVPVEEIDPNWGKCPLLSADECPIYADRPFECRGLYSKTNCRNTGHADMDTFTVSVNSVFRQYIEHVDESGVSGNLTDILLLIEADENRKNYRNSLLRLTRSTVSNQSIPTLMIPPEHRQKIEPILESIHNIRV